MYTVGNEIKKNRNNYTGVHPTLETYLPVSVSSLACDCAVFLKEGKKKPQKSNVFFCRIVGGKKGKKQIDDRTTYPVVSSRDMS